VMIGFGKHDTIPVMFELKKGGAHGK